MDRASLIKLIHVARKTLQLDDDTYREALSATVPGKTSCRDMSLAELDAVLTAFRKKGFKRHSAPRQRGLKPASVPAKLRAIWRTLHRQGFIRSDSDASLNGWVARQTAPHNGGLGVRSYLWLDRSPELAVVVLESLKRWHRREMLAAGGLPPTVKMSYSNVCDWYARQRVPAR
ncbi:MULTISPECIES: gp16 family protein [Serratia]|uniref:gp16 family protein n=1 Tax=Serratia TaxID=613 RepID=UPI00065F7A23|nr:phage protein GemA/Gp16 family protein [Serratia sp. 506_PEND]